jgi:excisionase family DNA binding protein
MASSTSNESWLTPPQLAKQLGVSPEKVLTWIRSGELPGVNVAERLTGRPRWRISPEALEQFLKRRESSPPPRVLHQHHRLYTPRRISEDDCRLGKNIPHDVRVKRIAQAMANRKHGQGAEWRPYVSEAVERYAERTGVKVDKQAVVVLKSCWEE